MDDYHQHVERQIQDMKQRMHLVYRDPNNPTARVIHHELQKAEDAARGRHDLRHVEERLKVAQNQIDRARYMPEGSQIMHQDYADHFHHNIEDMRNDMRRRANF